MPNRGHTKRLGKNWLPLSSL